MEHFFNENLFFDTYRLRIIVFSKDMNKIRRMMCVAFVGHWARQDGCQKCEKIAR